MNGTVMYTPTTPSRTNGIAAFFQANWFKIAFLAVLAFVTHNNDANIQIPPSQFTSGAVLTSYTTQETQTPAAERTLAPSTSVTSITEVPQVPITDNDAPLFLETEKVYGTQATKTKKVTQKRKDSHAYVKRFKATAMSEMKKYGIPASITLAQGILESNAGASRLANDNNNHFGMTTTRIFSANLIRLGKAIAHTASCSQANATAISTNSKQAITKVGRRACKRQVMQLLQPMQKTLYKL